MRCDSWRRRTTLAVAAAVMAAGAGEAHAHGTAARASDRAAPLPLVVGGPRRQAVLESKALVVSLRCPDGACTAVASARARLPRAGLGLPTVTIHTPTRTARLRRDRATRLQLELSERQLQAIAGRFQSGQHPRLTVHVRARDRAGRRATRAYTITTVIGDA